MDNPGEILRLCRLCLVKDQVNIPIFEEQGDIRQIFLKISSCLPVKVSRDDQLPKKICDGCSNKLDLFYEFWNTSANAEKTLLSWLGQAGVKDADETISAVTQQIAKPAETQVKQEALEDGHANQVQDSFASQSFEEEAKDESEAPPPKRARRTAAVKAQINITPESDDDDDMDNAEAMTKVEDESEESDGEDKDPSYSEVPGTSADDQAGPSGVGKDGVEAPACDKPYIQKKDIKVVVLDPAFYDFSKCKRCGKIIPTKNFRSHIIRHIRLDRQTVPLQECKLCGKVYKDLKKHIEVIHENLRVPHPCDLCGKALSSKYAYNNHIKLIHERNMNACCEICGKGYVFPSQLAQHFKSAHSNDEEITFVKCTVEGCPKVFKSATALKCHLPSHQEVRPTYPCAICSKLYSSQMSLKIHHRTQHDKERKKYTCHLCNKEINSRWSLNCHIRTHTGEKPFICEWCGKGFTSYMQLGVHTVVHTKEKKHVCRICKKSFTQRGSLVSHFQKSHPSEKC